MKTGIAMVLALGTVLFCVPVEDAPGLRGSRLALAGDTATQPDIAPGPEQAGAEPEPAGTPVERVVLDISVHTVGELQVLLDRAEDLADELNEPDSGASIILVLHGPEVEYFSRKNYDRYRDIVDQAARLDAIDLVDVKICQTMMRLKGIERDDIPDFIEQVPLGPAEINRLIGEGYVYF